MSWPKYPMNSRRPRNLRWPQMECAALVSRVRVHGAAMLSFKSQVKSMPVTLLTMSEGKLESKQPARITYTSFNWMQLCTYSTHTASCNKWKLTWIWGLPAARYEIEHPHGSTCSVLLQVIQRVQKKIKSSCFKLYLVHQLLLGTP